MDFNVFVFSGRVVSVDPGRTKDHRAYKKFRIQSILNGHKSVFNSFVVWGACEVKVGCYVFVTGTCHEYTRMGDTNFYTTCYANHVAMSKTDSILKSFDGIHEPDARKDTLEEVTIPEHCLSKEPS